jgi:hypothetical protein
MIFSKGYRITQEFGARPDYYKQFGFDGHEGLDVVPKVAGDTVIYCIEDGEVIRDVDNPKSGAYGEHVVVWNRNNRRAWWYCHLSSNVTNLGQMVRAGEVIGVMGATGNTQGAHLHLNVRKTDDNKNPIETNNGYKGFVNPLPILQIINNPPMANTIQVDTKLYEKLVGNSTAKKEVAEYLKIVNPDDASAEDMKRVIGGIQSLVTTAQNESSQSRVELSNAKEEIIRIREALLKSDTSKDGLLREAKTLRDLTESQGRDIGGLKKEKVELENQIRELKKGTITSLDSATLLRLAILKFLHLG